MRRKYTDVQLAEAVKTSFSVRQVLAKLELVEAGGNYSLIQRRMETLHLDVSHFKGQSWRKGQEAPVTAARPLHQLLVDGSQVQSYKLKRRLLKAQLKEEKCEMCFGTSWLGNPIPLELDHINGHPTDNRLENLRLLCPNCHALTETYRGKKLAKCRDETAPA